MKTDEQIMNEMADSALEMATEGGGFIEKPYSRYRYHNGFIAGWQARDKVLIERGVEFDEESAKETAWKRFEEWNGKLFPQAIGYYETAIQIEAMRWQHEQLVKVYEAKLAEKDALLDKALEALKALEAIQHIEEARNR